MRNTKFTKLICALIAVALLVGCVAMISASADTAGESTNSVSVVSKNAAYEARTELVFALKTTAELQENQTLYLLFWEENPEAAALKSGEELYKSALYRKTGKITEDVINDVEGCYVIKSKGIAAPKINSDIYVCAVIKTAVADSDNVTYQYEKCTNVFTYSVKQYATDKLSESDITEAQRRLYNNLLTYGNIAENKFGGSN